MNKTASSSGPIILKPAPLFVVLSGPSGVGKDIVLHRILSVSPGMNFITTWTTRPQRPSEKDHIDYHFVTREQYEKLLSEDGFLEHAAVYDRLYGVPRGPVREALRKGEDAIVRVDVQGAETIKKKLPDAVCIFLMPPSMQELSRRLMQRYTETEEQRNLRLGMAASEMEKVHLFDYVVINDEIERTICEIMAIIIAEKHRANPRRIML
jgi:guanylate kinase